MKFKKGDVLVHYNDYSDEVEVISFDGEHYKCWFEDKGRDRYIYWDEETLLRCRFKKEILNSPLHKALEE